MVLENTIRLYEVIVIKQNLMVFFNTIRFYIVNFMKQNLMVFFNTIRFYFYIVKSDGIGEIL